MKVTDLDRNDVEGAMAVYRADKAAGTWSPDKAQFILMLQDDPDELMKRLASS